MGSDPCFWVLGVCVGCIQNTTENQTVICWPEAPPLACPVGILRGPDFVKEVALARRIFEKLPPPLSSYGNLHRAPFPIFSARILLHKASFLLAFVLPASLGIHRFFLCPLLCCRLFFGIHRRSGMLRTRIKAQSLPRQARVSATTCKESSGFHRFRPEGK